jgi:hypothetical protein
MVATDGGLDYMCWYAYSLRITYRRLTVKASLRFTIGLLSDLGQRQGWSLCDQSYQRRSVHYETTIPSFQQHPADTIYEGGWCYELARL